MDERSGEMENSKSMAVAGWVLSGVLFLVIARRMEPEQSFASQWKQWSLRGWTEEHVIEPVMRGTLSEWFPVFTYEKQDKMDWRLVAAQDFMTFFSPVLSFHTGTSGNLSQWGKEDTMLSEWGQSAGGKTEIISKNSLTLPKKTGKLYTAQELSNVALTKSLYVISRSTVVYDSDFDGKKLMEMDLRMKQSSDKPQILIYHTHSQEGYVDSVSGNPATGVVGVGDYLASLLESFGYQVIHLKDEFDVVNGKTDRNNAYERASVRLEEVLAEHPSIEVILDIHRDGVDDSVHLVTDVGGKKTAKLMFFNGMSRPAGEDYPENPHLQENLAMSLQMKCLGMAYYPGLTRPNFIRESHYNMSYRGKSMLIEVGAQTNTLAEAKNAMEPLAIMLHELLQ